MLLLPEGRFRLQPVDEEGAAFQRSSAMARCGTHENDALAGGQSAETMDHTHAQKRPAGHRVIHNAFDLLGRHRGVMLKLERCQPIPSPYNAGEACNASSAAASKSSACIEIRFIRL
jgi:hypothetical protein